MADTNDRKRNRASLDEDQRELSIISDEQVLDKSLDIEVEQTVCEPLSKYARKSTSPKPNLQIIQENTNISNNIIEIDEQIQCKSIEINVEAPNNQLQNLESNDCIILDDIKETCNAVQISDNEIATIDAQINKLPNLESNDCINLDEIKETVKEHEVIEIQDDIENATINGAQNNKLQTLDSNDCIILHDTKKFVNAQVSNKEVIEIQDEIETMTIDSEDIKLQANDCIILDNTKEIVNEQVSNKEVIEIQDEIETMTIDSENIKLEANDCIILDNTKEIVNEQDNFSNAKLIDSKSVEPIITISFINEEVLSKYKVKFIDFINKFVEFNSNQIENVINIALKDDADIPNEANKKNRKKNKRAKKEKELFVLDTAPTSMSGNAQLQYNSKFKVIDDLIIDEIIEDDGKSKISMCFNCDGNHNLQSCPDKKDFNKIREARQKFLSSRPPPSVRYHVEETQKYDGLKPGKVTENLRKALGIGSNEVPEFIYRMRSLGYPPGWLEDAQEIESSLEIYGVDKKDIKDKLTKPHVNPDKIIDYPGFNVELGNNCRDEYKLFNCPPYSVAYSKDAMIKFINNQQGNLETIKVLDKSKEVAIKSDLEPRISPSLIDLESKKEALLAALDDPNPEINISIDKESEDVIGDVSITNLDVESPLISTPSKIESPLILTPASNRIVKISSFGTPILKSASPFRQLPNADNFSKDVAPLINFENLPNSTGKYDQLTIVLDKVRKSLKDIQEKPV